MPNNNLSGELMDTIHLLETEQDEKGRLLKEQFHLTYESLKPVNIIKNTLNDITSAPFLTDNILGSVVGLATGYLTRVIVVGRSVNIFRKLFGSLIQLAVSRMVAQNRKGIKTLGDFLIAQFSDKQETDGSEE
jgi:hypothetical protein